MDSCCRTSVRENWERNHACFDYRRHMLLSIPQQSVLPRTTQTMDSSLSVRPLVLPVYIQAAECPGWLRSCPWALPMLIHVEGSDVGIILLRLNARRIPELKTSSHENSGTRAMEDICPFCNCTSSRNAIHHCVSATCHSELTNHHIAYNAYLSTILTIPMSLWQRPLCLGRERWMFRQKSPGWSFLKV